MSFRGIPENILEQIRPEYLSFYVESTGWQSFDAGSRVLSYYHRPSNDAVELAVPLEPQYRDYKHRLYELIESISDFEHRTINDVVIDLVLPSDVFRFRTESSDTTVGDIGLENGINLYNGIRRTLVASAMDELRPRKFHERMQQVDADAFVNTCRIGQSEYGSYVARVICPLRAAFNDLRQSQLSFLDFEKSELAAQVQNGLPRKTTARMMSTFTRVATSIATGSVDELINQEDSQHLISSNFFEALAEMEPTSADGTLTIVAHWSPVVVPINQVANQVTFNQKDFTVISGIARALRPVDEPVVDEFLGKITTLAGQEGADSLMQGDVVVTILYHDELIRARIDLSHEDYTIACDAHKLGRYILVSGVLTKETPRVLRIENYSNLEILDEVTYSKDIKLKYALRVQRRLASINRRDFQLAE